MSLSDIDSPVFFPPSDLRSATMRQIMFKIFEQLSKTVFFVLGLDIPKHGEPAYPLASYGDGWSESPSAPRQALPFSHSNGVTPVQSNYPEKGGGIDNPSLEVIEAPNKNETTEF